MLLQYFENLEAGLEAKLRGDPRDRSPRKRYALEVARLGKRLYGGACRVAWCGVTAPFDLLSAMGVTSCFVEFVGAMLASTGGIAAMLAEAERAGYSTDTCGYHRSVLGAALQGMLPVPDLLIGTTCPCTGGLAAIENLARHFGKDLFVLQIPQDESDRSVAFLARQMQQMVRFVSSHTGQELDPARLARAMDCTNRTRELMVETYALARRVPSPAGGRDLQNFGIVTPLFLGTEAGVEVARTFRDEFAARVSAGAAGIPDERFRLLWIQNRIQFKNPLVQLLENDWGASIVTDELNDVTWDPIDPEDPYTGLARRTLSIPLNGSVDHRLRHLRKLAREYRIHGAINPCHWGCRQGTGARGLIEEGLKEIGVPVLNLEVDCVDTRNFAQGQIKTRLEAFIEMLAGRPWPWETG